MRRTALYAIAAVAVMTMAAYLLVLPARGKDAKLKAEEVVAKHLEAIGTSEARAAAKTRAVEGAAENRQVVGGSTTLKGSAGLYCDGRKLKIVMKFPGVPAYPGEQWLFDGNQAMVAMTAPGARSEIGNFLFNYQEVLREGLLGGTLSTAWPLLDVASRQAKLSYQGLKKVDGRELHQLTYQPKKGGSNLEIRLYFEPETFRHVRTVYYLNLGGGIGSDVGQHVDEIRYTLVETFSDFQTLDGLTLPSRWTLQFEIQPSRRGMMEWSMKMERMKHNIEM